MHAYHGKDERRIPPLILGHEVSGIIQEGSEKGKKVVLNPLITCGNCDYCNSGSEHLCSKRVLLGMNRPIERQGGFAEFVSIPKRNIYNLPLFIDETPLILSKSPVKVYISLADPRFFLKSSSICCRRCKSWDSSITFNLSAASIL